MRDVKNRPEWAEVSKHAHIIANTGPAVAREVATYAEVLQAAAEEHPARLAYTYLPNGEGPGVEMTVAALDLRARAIAAKLQEISAPGDRALLMFETGLEYISAFFGCLYSGVMGVPVCRPNPERLESTIDRIKLVANDSAPRSLLSGSLVMEGREALQSMGLCTAGEAWINTEEVDSAQAENWLAPRLTASTIAYLQYTSGSTSNPRGVMISHGNLLNNSHAISAGSHSEVGDVNVSWLPQFHDFGLIGNILHTIYSGGHTVLMAPEDFVRKPLRWLKAISAYKAKSSRFPNFALDLTRKRTTPEDRDALDLSHWTVATNGAEPLRASSLREFVDYFGSAGFKMESHAPAYGLAEFTLYTTFVSPRETPRVLSVNPEALARNIIELAEEGAEGAREIVGCGNVHGDTRVVIVDAETHMPLAPDEVGEIWLQGGSVAQGYWNNPEESQRVFGATLGGREEEGAFLRTGDLGFIHGGELFFSGRLKDLIVIGGMNHYPQDIEATIEAVAEGIRPGCTAAFSVDRANGEQVVVVAECSAGSNAAQRKADKIRILEAVSMKNEIGIRDIVFVKPKNIPKTSSGKLQRFACRERYESNRLDVLEDA